MADSLVRPLINKPSKVDLEAAQDYQIQCRICLETDGRDFIAPCKCKGSSKYVHRECLDHWRAVKEGFAFAHCTTCKAPFYLRVNDLHRKWRTLKFRFFVSTDILFIFLGVQLVIAALGYLAYAIDTDYKFWLRLHYGFGSGLASELAFYYICGALLFFALMGLTGCFMTCFNESVRSDFEAPCRNLLSCCCCCGRSANSHVRGTSYTSGSTNNSYGTTYNSYGTPYICIDCNGCCDNCSNSTCDGCSCTECECGDCLRRCDNGDCGGVALVFLTVAVILIGIFAIIGLFYSVLVATMVGQRIWQRHYHILEKKMLTKEYAVEDVGEVDGNHWSPPSLPEEHVQQLEALGLM